MTVSMDKVVFHEHFKKRHRSDTSNNIVKTMAMAFVVGDGLALNESFNENTGSCTLLDGFGELYFITIFEHLTEKTEIPRLDVEVYLIYESLFEGLLAYRYLASSRKDSQCFAYQEEEIYISFDIGFNTWMPYFYGYFLSFVDCLIDLTDRS